MSTTIANHRRTLRRTLLLCSTCAALFWSVPSFGHHALTEYDDTQVKSIDGTLIEILLKNPHSLLTIQLSRPDGGTDRWTVEWLAAVVLRREAVENTTLKPGDRVIVSGHPSRDRSAHRVWLRTITRPADGWTWAGAF